MYLQTVNYLRVQYNAHMKHLHPDANAEAESLQVCVCVCLSVYVRVREGERERIHGSIHLEMCLVG